MVVIPELADSAAVEQWLGTVRGKFVLVSAPEIMCRAPQELERFARAATVTKINAQRVEALQDWQRLASAPSRRRTHRSRRSIDCVQMRLDSAGVIGIGTLTWSGGWGVDKIFGANAERAPTVDISCEDYGLLHRLATNKSGTARSPHGRIAGDAGGGADVRRRRRDQGQGAA